MPFTEEEKKQRRKETQRRYREKNKEKIKNHYQDNREKVLQKVKEYREKNKEKIKENKEYNQTLNGKKNGRINNWKRQKIVTPCSWDEFYILWENAINCADCEIVMTINDGCVLSTTKCVDHDHSITDGSPNFRDFVCCACNNNRRM